MLRRRILHFFCVVSFLSISNLNAKVTNIGTGTSPTGVGYSLSYNDEGGPFGSIILSASSQNVNPQNQISIGAIYLPGCSNTALGMCMYMDVRTSNSEPNLFFTLANGVVNGYSGQSTADATMIINNAIEQKAIEDGKVTFCIMGTVDNSNYYHSGPPWYNNGGDVVSDGACSDGTPIHTDPVKPPTSCTMTAPSEIAHGVLNSSELDGASQEVDLYIDCNQETDVTLSFDGFGSSKEIDLTQGLSDTLVFGQSKLHIVSHGATKIISTLNASGEISPGSYKKSVIIMADWN